MSKTNGASSVQISSTMCSQCSSMANFVCLNHCNDVFCGKCSVKHRTNIAKQMTDLTEQLKQCRIDPSTTQDEMDEHFVRASQQTLQQTHETAKNLVAEIQQREEAIIKQIEDSIEIRRKEREKRMDSALLTSDEATDYTHLLDDCLKSDQLVSADTMNKIQTRLNARNALRQSSSTAQNPLLDLGKYNMEQILRLRFAPRTELLATTDRRAKSSKNIIAVTVRLDKRKIFHKPLEQTFSLGQHPIVITLNGHYLETFLFRRSDNSLVLSRTTAIDVINRGTGIERSVPVGRIIGTIRDKILAGTWSEQSQRLIFNGNHRMYFFYIPEQQCADVFFCQPVAGDLYNTPRYLGCTPDNSIIYAFKNDSNTYTIQKLAHPVLPAHPPYEPIKGNALISKKTEQINGYVAAMCVTHNRIGLVYRRTQVDKNPHHYFAVLDHNFNRPNKDDFLLPSYTKWITGMTSFGNGAQFLLCDPRGQQLLLYNMKDNVLTRRLRVGAINACCLTDGKLVLVLHKQYPTSPAIKLHFITPPHVQDSIDVAKSLPLLRARSSMN